MRRDLLDTHDRLGRDRSVSRVRRSTSRHRSSYRKCARPAPTTTVGSSGMRSVHCRGSRASSPESSWKKTRYSPHVCRHSIKWKARPRSGWKGCVTRNVRGALLVGGAIDGVRQPVCGTADRVHSSRVPRSPDHPEFLALAVRPDGVLPLLPSQSHASRPEERRNGSSPSFRRLGRQDRGLAPSRRASPSVRTSHCIGESATSFWVCSCVTAD